MKRYEITLTTPDNFTAEFDGEKFIWDDRIESGFELETDEEALEVFKSMNSVFMKTEGVKHFKVELMLAVIEDDFSEAVLDEKTIVIDIT